MGSARANASVTCPQKLDLSLIVDYRNQRPSLFRSFSTPKISASDVCQVLQLVGTIGMFLKPTEPSKYKSRLAATNALPASLCGQC